MARRRTGRPVPRTEDVYSLALRLQRRELVGGLLHAVWESSHAPHMSLPGMSFRTALPSASTARRRSGGAQTSLARTSATLWCMVAWCGSR
jgi:hypothetical protein